MAFIVESGTGLENSNSFVTTDWATDYFADRGNEVWGNVITTAKEAALVLATDYINMNYIFTGFKLLQTQALQWPRLDAYDINDDELLLIPVVLKKATVELALLALSDATLIPNLDNNGKIKKERIEGAVEVEYTDAGYSEVRTFSYVDKLLLNFGIAKGKQGSSGQIKVIRT